MLAEFAACAADIDRLNVIDLKFQVTVFGQLPADSLHHVALTVVMTKCLKWIGMD